MKILREGGAKAVWPKILKCRNCGCEAMVESYEDMQALPDFDWVHVPSAPQKVLQFSCPNHCGASFVAVCAECRQEFHYATHVHYGGGENVACARFGSRVMTKTLDRKHRFTYKRTPRRRKGGDGGDPDGPLHAS